jgi:predicted GIY-YIG superfamily endonuclease
VAEDLSACNCALSLSKGIEQAKHPQATCPQPPHGLLRLRKLISMITGCRGSYILRCADDSFYVGSARDLEYRLQQHATGGGDAYARSRRPLALAWAQECEHIEDADVLEHKIKGWRGEKARVDQRSLRRSAAFIALRVTQASGARGALGPLCALRQAQRTFRQAQGAVADAPSTSSSRLQQMCPELVEGHIR